MTPKEKAFELVKKFIWIDVDAEPNNIDYDMLISELRYHPVDYALIVVDEILNNGFQFTDESEYWHEVKQYLLKIQ